MRRPALVLLCLFASTALAQVPDKLGYSGRLLKSNGAPETGAQQFTFAIYGAETGGTALWTETQTILLANDGLYSTMLGAATAIPSSVWTTSGGRWLEVGVGGTTLSPRQTVGSVAFAQVAKHLVGGTVDATSIKVNGTEVITAGGKLASGALTPGAGLATDGSGNLSLQACSGQGQYLQWSASTSSWTCASPAAGVTAGRGLVADGGVLAIDFGSGANQVCLGNDARLSDARTPSGSAGGDLAGTYPNPTVKGLRGAAVSAAAPNPGDVLQYIGTMWTPTPMPLAGATAAVPGLMIPGAGLGAASGTVSVNYGAAANTAISGDKLIQASVTYTVGPAAGANYPDLVTAWGALYLKRIAPNAVVTLQLQAGTHTFAQQFIAEHPDGQNIAIKGDEATPANVVLSFPNSNGFLLRGANLRSLSGVLIQGNVANSASSLGYSGIYATNNASMTLGTGVQIKDFLNGMHANMGAAINANNVRVLSCAPSYTGGSSMGILAQYGGAVMADSANITGCDWGVLAFMSGSVGFQRGTVTGAKAYGLIAHQGGTVYAYLANISGLPGTPVSYAVMAQQNGSVMAQGAIIQNASYGIYSQLSSNVYAYQSNVTATVAGMTAMTMSSIYAPGAVVTAPTTYTPAVNTVGALGGYISQ